MTDKTAKKHKNKKHKNKQDARKYKCNKSHREKRLY